ncbi:MAG: kynureninase [Flavobacteriales bacterium]|nr:kynureninase [Flavobacteriales bacterium]
MKLYNSFNFVQQLDTNDPLRSYRDRFHHPKLNGQTARYFCGNSLGLQPKSVKDAIAQELDDWAEHAVEGHFKAKNPWFNYQDAFAEPIGRIVGALPKEVTVMNALTVNLHLLMVSFYRPQSKRFKIVCEAKAFPSDQYAIESQVCHHGFYPKDAIIEVTPRPGEHLIREEDILRAIAEHGESVALVLFGGVNYYTGQAFDMRAITEAGHAVGAKVGFDLAHAFGNIPLELHEWDVDFATWCTYKYLNSSPGGMSGIFVHERHCNSPEIVRFAGWWGNDPQTRFLMEPGFVPAEGARGWQLSNVPVLTMAAHMAAVRIHDEVGMERLRAKSLLLTGYLEFLINDVADRSQVEIITPVDPEKRGCQLSLFVKRNAKELHSALLDAGVITDYREPNVIRLAPVPLYNSFEDVWIFSEILRHHLLGKNA